MKKIIFTILICCIFILLGTGQSMAEDVYDISQYFPLNVDDTWIYKATLIKDVGYSEYVAMSAVKEKGILDGKEVYAFENNLNEKPLFYYSKDKDGIYLHKIVYDDSYSILIPPGIFLTNQMQLNKENTFSGKAKLYGDKGELIEEYRIEMRNKLEGIENLSVPAGKFENCLRINSVANFYKKRNAMTIEQTIWLAKDVGKVKEQSLVTVYNGEPRIFRNRLVLEKAMLQDK
jgi:hypothetical protein